MKVNIGRVLPCWGRFRWGTVVSPSNLRGKKTLFYRGEDQQHRPVSDYFRQRIGIKPKRDRVIMLFLPSTYRALMAWEDKDFKRETIGVLDRMPLGMKSILFQEHRAGLMRLFGKPIARTGIPIWGRDGVYLFRLGREPVSGTITTTPIPLLEL